MDMQMDSSTWDEDGAAPEMDLRETPEVLIGSTVDATYHEQAMPEYRGNPMIEALPPPPSTPHELVSMLGHDIVCTRACRDAPDDIRIDMADRLNQFILPQERMRKLYRRVSSMIRSGYVDRNPKDVAKWHQLHKDARRQLETEDGAPPVARHARSHSIGMAVFGPSGVGKSSAVNQVLKTFPQRIRHRDPQSGHPIVEQLVWLMATCPPDAGPPALCASILDAFDAVLGTNYSGSATSRGLSANQMKRMVISLAHSHALGLLVIDEIQLLSSARSGNGQQVMDLLLTLMNDLRVPILLVGTGEAVEILSSKLQNARRFVGKGALEMKRMERHGEFPQLVEMLWDRCFLRDMPSFSALLEREAEERENGGAVTGEPTRILDTLYAMSAGVHDLVVRLFVLGHETFFDMQEEHLLADEDAIPMPEILTAAVFERVYEQEFKILQPFIVAMLQGRDVGSVEYDLALGRRRHGLGRSRPSGRTSRASGGEQVVIHVPAAATKPSVKKSGVGKRKEVVMDPEVRAARRAHALSLVGEGIVNRGLLDGARSVLQDHGQT